MREKDEDEMMEKDEQASGSVPCDTGVKQPSASSVGSTSTGAVEEGSLAWLLGLLLYTYVPMTKPSVRQVSIDSYIN